MTLSNQTVGFYSENLLQKMRLEADPVADKIVDTFMQSGYREMLYRCWSVLDSADPNAIDSLPEKLKIYLSQTQHLPSWANVKRIEKGQYFFAKYARSILSILGCLSLPYCYAAADGAQVLWLSQRIRQDTHQRLTETAQFLIDVSSPQSFRSTGKAIRKIQQVRIIHAVSRYYAQQSTQWNLNWGIPVNQEDMAGTNLAFSYIVLQGLQKLGFQWQKQEAEDFLYLWNVIGYMLGVREELLPQNLQQAYWLDKRIAGRHFQRSEAGVELTQALLKCLYEINKGSSSNQTFIHAYMRYLLTDPVADLLQIPEVGSINIFKPIFKTTNVLSALTTLGKSGETPGQITKTLVSELQQNSDTHLRLPVLFG